MGQSVALHKLASVWILVSVVGFCATKELTIAAFNVQIFGQKKSEDAFVMDILVKIIQRYDIILIQEIRDTQETAIVKLLDRVNAATPSNLFDMEVSERMGRSNSKEQYAFLYRKKSGLRVENLYIYDDGDESQNNKKQNIIVDTFEREPFILLFSSTTTALKEFALAGIHIAPDDAVEEIKALKEVFIDIHKKMRASDVMIMGDLNADCSYVRKKDWEHISLKSDPRYTWLIDDGVDTTVSKTDCAYDRFIGTRNGFSTTANGGVVPGSAQVFNYQEEYKLSSEEALRVSDHFPIEFKLKDKDTGKYKIADKDADKLKLKDKDATSSKGKTGRLRSAHILNVYVKVPGKSLSVDGKYYINDETLNVKTEDGTIVGELNDVTKKEKDIRFAVETILKKNLYIDKIRVEMVRTRKYRGKQLSKLIIKFANSVYTQLELALETTIKKYGNVVFI